MIKRFFCALGLLMGGLLAAAEAVVPSQAALYGDLASALEISSEPVRQAALLKLLAASRGDASLDLVVYGLLQTEFAEKAPGKMVREQLAKLYKEYPADLLIVSLYADYGEVENKQAMLEKALNEIKPPSPQDQRFTCYMLLIGSAMESITAEGDPLETAWQEKLFDTRLALLDRVIAKQKTEPLPLLAMRLRLLRKALYFCDDLVPEQKQFGKISAAHRRKKLYCETLERWKKFLYAKDKIAFMEQFDIAIALDLPECGHFAAEALRRYGMMDEVSRNNIVQAAIARKDYGIYRPLAGENSLSDTIVAVGCGDFKAAKETAKSPLMHRYVALSKAAETQDKATVDRILNTLTPQMPLSSLEYQALLQMAEVTRDAGLYRRLREMLLSQSKAEELRNDLANSLAFVAVTLNVDLELAAKLLERVCAEETNSAYTDSLAMLRLRQKRYDEAAKLIREAFELREPGETASVFLLHAAQIMAAKGDKAQARRLLERARRCVRPGDFEYDVRVEKKLTELLK